MAARSSVPIHPNAPLSTRQLRHEAQNDRPKLPRGGCNYTNLCAVGAPKCGCRRYWDKELCAVDERGVVSKSAMCMCEHHACFHDDEPEESRHGRAQPELSSHPARSTTPKQQYLEPIPRRPSISEASTHRVARDSTLPDTVQWSRFIHHSGSPEALPAIPSQCLLPSENGSWTTTDSQPKYHLPFGGQGLNTLSHIPRRALGEIAEPKSAQPLVENTRAIGNGREMQVYTDANGNMGLQSITELATPSLATSVDHEAAEYGKSVAEFQATLEELSRSNPQAAASITRCIKEGSVIDSSVILKRSNSPAAGDSSTAKLDDHLFFRLQSIAIRLARLPHTMENHEKRLDALENASFTFSAVEELQEDHKIVDVRVGELEAKNDTLESRVLDLEKGQLALDAASVGSSHDVAASIDSRVSTVTSVHRADLEALKEEVAELRSLAPPSHARPWEVEVVFLPFGYDLKGVWRLNHEMSQHSRANSSGETRTQNQSMAAAQAMLTAPDQVLAWERSGPDFDDPIEVSWLNARACSRGSIMDQRLRSRGLVKQIQVFGPDAIDVQTAIMTAFGNLPDLLVDDPYTPRDDEKRYVPNSSTNYLGLQASWIPLRKLHKNSSLRFLSTSEMLTPALWTVQFLATSVAMRTKGLRRLYVTHRDGYIQQHGDPTDWTWQKLRQLPRVYYPDQMDPSLTDHTPEADAEEPCWAFDAYYDPPPLLDVNTSFASQVSELSIRSLRYEEPPVSPSDHFSSAPLSPIESSTPVSRAPPVRRPASPVMERNPFRPLHIRTISMPTSVRLKSPAPSSKRRIGSFEQEVPSSPSRATSTSTNTVLKRRRISRSPSRAAINTPRWSAAPSSPYAYVEETTSKRATTPFAYATPHSNAPYVDTRPKGAAEIEIYQDRFEDSDDGGDFGSATNEFEEDDSGGEILGGSDADRESSDPDDIQPDEEWQGVEDRREGTEYEGHSRATPSFGLGLGLLERVDSMQRDDDEDVLSDASSGPSEYMFDTQSKMKKAKKERARARALAGFEIHVDEE
ncbi:hypothetical protein HYALB_00011057 [Hymenoscyphus albidus]|uniref:Uncharacterized protein n=1 Tax=Hymenoscyphus albidus TaxID=595503 RepID=A0A9N9LSN1_9HELO|nr:hypothetical protein HYALB_00011057 [Hymenoscyphus albidus]